MSTAPRTEPQHPRPVVVGLGELLWDAGPAGRSWGGAPANFACLAGQLGAEAWVVSAVGDDDDGALLLRETRARGVQACVGVAPDAATGRVDVDVGEGGAPTYRIADDSAWDHLQWTEQAAALAARADAVCFGSLAQRRPGSRATIERFLDAAPPRALRIFDANLRPPSCDPEVVARSLARADVLKVNEHEWPQLAGWLGLEGGFERAGRALCARAGLRLVVRTLGARGSEAVGPEGLRRAGAGAVVATDTVGAGDAFTAACCVGLLQGAPLEASLAAAADVAAFVCTQPGGAPQLPEDLLTRFRSRIAPIR